MKKKLILLVLLAAALIVPAVVFGYTMLVTNRPLSSDGAEYYRLKGDELFRQGDLGLAKISYEQAVALRPDYEEALNNLAFIYNKEENYASAKDALSKLIVIGPDNAKYHYDYATNIILLIKQTSKGELVDLETALAEFKKADELSPGIGNAKENIAFVESLLQAYRTK